MTVYTKAAFTTTQGICEGGLERTNEALKKLGLDMNSWVSMQLIMRELGLSDTLFSFCKVKKGCEEEASNIVRLFLALCANNAIAWLVQKDRKFENVLYFASKAIAKRCEGINRKELLAQEYKRVNEEFKKESDPAARYMLDCIRCCLSDKPDHLAATHASIALMDGGAILGIRTEVHGYLCKCLNDLMGPEDDNGKEIYNTTKTIST